MAYDARVERLRWLLLAATGGGIVACAGKSIDASTDHNRGGETSAGGNADPSEAGDSGRAGANTGGRAGSGGVPLPGTGGSAASGAGGTTGRAGTGGGGVAGTTALAGTGGAVGGFAGQPPEVRSCEPVKEYGPGTTLCEGDFVHRTERATCPLPPRSGGEGGSPSEGGAGGAENGGANQREEDACQHDLDCTLKPNGYCIEGQEYENGGYKYCYYACETDADCGSDEVCSCKADSLGRCIAAACKTDAECGDGLLCISPLDIGGCDGSIPYGFHCQALVDECAGHDECGDDSCEHTEGRFQCQGVAVCGRPFLVEGRARLACLSAGSSWLEDGACSPISRLLSADHARRIAHHWLDNALMEHASIAAFARFSLELLAVGAPAELLEESARAMSDEIRHTKLCVSLARRFGADNAAPGQLDMTGALATVELLDVVERAILEGCIGETTAALEAGWAADAATDPGVREVLHAIAEDEARHAALAFRFVAWAARRDERVGPLLERHVRAAGGERTKGKLGNTGGREAAELARHGVLDVATRREARRAALREVVAPALSRLVRVEVTMKSVAADTV